MADSYEGLSKDELIELLQGQEDEIESLNRDLESARRGKKGGKSDAGSMLELADLTTENDELREQQSRDAAEIAKLKEKFSESNAVQKRVEEEKLEAEVRAREYSNRIDTLEKEIVEVTNKSRTAEMHSQEAGKQKSNTIKETKRLFEENDKLREEVKILCAIHLCPKSYVFANFLILLNLIFDFFSSQNKKLGEIVQAHDDNIRLLEALIIKQADEKDDLELHRDKHDIIKDDLQNQINQLEYALEQTSEKLQVDDEYEIMKIVV